LLRGIVALNVVSKSFCLEVYPTHHPKHLIAANIGIDQNFGKGFYHYKACMLKAVNSFG
jgi:hypothetical protein